MKINEKKKQNKCADIGLVERINFFFVRIVCWIRLFFLAHFYLNIIMSHELSTPIFGISLSIFLVSVDFGIKLFLWPWISLFVELRLIFFTCVVKRQHFSQMICWIRTNHHAHQTKLTWPVLTKIQFTFQVKDWSGRRPHT